MKNTAVLLLSTPIPLARKGAVSAIIQFLVTHKGSILHADDHVDSDRNVFLSRLEWDLDVFDIRISDFDQYFRPVALEFMPRGLRRYQQSGQIAFRSLQLLSPPPEL